MKAYEILGLQPGASIEAIKAAYQKLSRQWHPKHYTGSDRLGAALKFRELTEAYRELLDAHQQLGDILQSAEFQTPPIPAQPDFPRPSRPQIEPISAPRDSLLEPPRSTRIQPPSPSLPPTPAHSEPLPETPLERQAGIALESVAEIQARLALPPQPDAYEAAQRAFDRGDFEEALGFLTPVLEKEPDKAEAHALHIKLLDATQGDKRILVKALENCIRINKKDVESIIRLAEVYQSMGMHTRATRYWEQAYNLAPDHPHFKATSGEKSSGAMDKAGEIVGSVKNLMEGAKGFLSKMKKR